MSKATIFAPENSTVGWTEAEELSRMTGLKPEELIAFKPHRLAQHRCLIRVTAELHVPDGPRYADLGLNLRSMASNIYNGSIKKKMDQVEAACSKQRVEIITILNEIMTRILAPPEAKPSEAGFLGRLLGPKPPAPQTTNKSISATLDVFRLKNSGETGLRADCIKTLIRVCNGVMSQRGALRTGDGDWVVFVAANIVANSASDALVAQMVDPWFDAGVKARGYRRLPPQDAPVVLNAKGASASGKSTIRNQQRQIATRLGLDWADFAIVSPDYWRKNLIDYEGLGEDYKYAAMLCGQELAMIDHKLDRLMAQLGDAGKIPHLLIDRFRFDSFQLAEKRPPDTQLLTRFGAKIYLFFMITPPQETVIRAWERGLTTGRYKAVDDLLYHNIEAYSGMPGLFFSWASLRDRWMHYEFLDNSVKLGETPRTIAAGRNGHLVIADIDKFCDIERFRHVNVEAVKPEDVLSKTLDITQAMSLARRAMAQLPAVDILVPGSDRVFATARDGRIEIDPSALPKHIPAEAFGNHDLASNKIAPIDPAMWTETIGASVRAG